MHVQLVTIAGSHNLMPDFLSECSWAFMPHCFVYLWVCCSRRDIDSDSASDISSRYPASMSHKSAFPLYVCPAFKKKPSLFGLRLQLRPQRIKYIFCFLCGSHLLGIKTWFWFCCYCSFLTNLLSCCAEYTEPEHCHWTMTLNTDTEPKHWR